ncbi:hypothetical protein JCM10207_003071 [Rhodosporidiobolus poonsookiae]
MADSSSSDDDQRSRPSSSSSKPPRADRSSPALDPNLSVRPCIKCRSRRVRCGRQLPTCITCERRGDSCTYPPYQADKPGQRSAVTRRVNEAKEKGKEVARTPPPIEIEEDDTEEEREDEAGPSSPAHETNRRATSSPQPPATLPSPISPSLRLRSPHRYTPPSSAKQPAVHVPPPARLIYPRFPFPQRASPEMLARKNTREALSKAITHGAEAPLERVELEGVDAGGLLIDLLACDSTFSAELSAPIFAPFTPSPPAAFSIPPPSTSQAHAALSAYFSAVEPKVGLYPSQRVQTAFQAACIDLWEHGTREEKPKPRGWKGMYLATVAVGAGALEPVQAHVHGMGQRLEEQEKVARAWAQQAVEALLVDGFPVRITLEAFRATLLLLYLDLAGYAGPFSIVKTLSALPQVVAAAFELGLNRQPDAQDEDAEDGCGLWWKLMELEAPWAVLLDRRLSIDPSSSSTQLSARRPYPSPVSSPQQTLNSSNDNAAQSPTGSTRAVRLVTTLHSKLQHLLNSPFAPNSLDLVLMRNSYDEAAAGVAACEGESLLAKYLLAGAYFRLKAAQEEAGESFSEAEEQEWEQHANDLLELSLFLARVDRVSHLLAITSYLQSVVTVMLRVRARASSDVPSVDSLSSKLADLVEGLRAAPWPVFLHQTLQRALLVFDFLRPKAPDEALPNGLVGGAMNEG